MRDGNVPRFFCAAKARRAKPADGVADGTAKRDPANRPAYGSAFLEMNSEKGRERRRERERRRGVGEGRRLFVKQIKTNKKDKCFRTCQTNCSLSSNLYHLSPQKYQIPAEKSSFGNSPLSWKILFILPTFFSWIIIKVA